MTSVSSLGADNEVIALFFFFHDYQYYYFPFNCIFTATDYDGKKDDLKRCLLNKRKADNSSEAIKSQESLDYAEDSLPGTVCSFLKSHQYHVFLPVLPPY